MLQMSGMKYRVNESVDVEKTFFNSFLKVYTPSHVNKLKSELLSGHPEVLTSAGVIAYQRPDGRIYFIKGNHRGAAAKDAGIPKILIDYLIIGKPAPLLQTCLPAIAEQKASELRRYPTFGERVSSQMNVPIKVLIK